MSGGLHLDIKNLSEFQSLPSKKQMAVLYQSHIQTNKHLEDIKGMIQKHDTFFAKGTLEHKYHRWVVYTWLTAISGVLGIKTWLFS